MPTVLYCTVLTVNEWTIERCRRFPHWIRKHLNEKRTNTRYGHYYTWMNLTSNWANKWTIWIENEWIWLRTKQRIERTNDIMQDYTTDLKNETACTRAPVNFMDCWSVNFMDCWWRLELQTFLFSNPNDTLTSLSTYQDHCPDDWPSRYYFEITELRGPDTVPLA